jgi:hypothetical protein
MCASFPLLFAISLVQEVTSQHVIQCAFDVPFRRRMSPRVLALWNEIKTSAMTVSRLIIPNTVIWSLTPNKIFSTKYVYQFWREI